ncbi:BTB/POZ domain with WD40/YVTN repeat-like protein [Actinidia rufa]|uniref:BTB/POZ domain with WD40/YVTN repeat-like protein n=1 Tax=Actinidia rufa TaxID=165716 RepID=A0A7J0DBU2_9ERIC|nr:BTB/POZ domain with WD40/YVTN repeat-like protein [Actinidia rufa]
MGIQNDRVRFNVGGKIFETTATTLAVAGRNSFFGAMFDENWNFQTENSHEFFIDRNPNCFSILIDLLRTGELFIPSNIPEKLLYREAQFYGLLDHVRAAKWGPFDGNQVRFSQAVMGQAPGDGTAIRAGPDGGCCVAHGSIVHVYDWMLQELPPINLDYQRVNDIGWIDAETVVAATSERLGRGRGGAALFGAATGELTHRFQVTHEDQVKSYTAGALSFSTDYKIFSSCKGRSNEYGIGVWDQITGQQIDFYYEPIGWSLGDADRLQWLDNTNCLLVATLFPRKDNCYISLLDFREKEHGLVMVRYRGSNHRREAGPRRDRYGREQFHLSRLMKGKMPDEPCYPKLALYDGQLFSSMNDSISVFSGPDWVLTSRLRRSYGGSICDFSIGGDRLFALHSEENVFDIWEAPPPPVT